MIYFLIAILIVGVIHLIRKSFRRRRLNSQIWSLLNLHKKPFEKLQTQAEDLILFEEFHHIVAITDQILRIVPTNHEALVLRALALEALNFNLEAIEDYELAHSKKQLDANTYGLFGLTYRKVGEIEKGQQFLKLSIDNGLKTYEGNYNYIKFASPQVIEILKKTARTPENLQQRNLSDFVKFLTPSNKEELLIAIKKQIFNIESAIKTYPTDKDYPKMLARAKEALNEFEQNGH